MGEGAGALVLEREEHARARGAKVLGRIAGYGASNDAFHITQPDEDGRGALVAMQRALADAGAEPADVGYINAHGTSTPMNDRIETLAIRARLQRPTPPPVSSTEALDRPPARRRRRRRGGRGVGAMRRGVLPPTINLDELDPECDIDYVADGPRGARSSWRCRTRSGSAARTPRLALAAA